MSVTIASSLVLDRPAAERTYHTSSGLILESWSEGFTINAVIILVLLTLTKYKPDRLLHNLILLELLLSFLHGTTIFTNDPGFVPYLSIAFTFLAFSFTVHNIVNFLKIRPFIGLIGQVIYIVTLVLAQGYWLLDIYAFWRAQQFGDKLLALTSPLSVLFRDSWWIFTISCLIYNIKANYDFGITKLVRVNRKFAVLMLCMALSVAFILADIVVSAAPYLLTNADINPYWRIAVVFKYTSDVIFLDDFKTVLDKIAAKNFDPFDDLEEDVAGSINMNRRNSDATQKMLLRKMPGENGRMEAILHQRKDSHVSILAKEWPGLPEPAIVDRR